MGTAGIVWAFFAALGIAYLLTPPAIRASGRLGFIDLPTGYKRHLGPTPCLGGAAVLGAFLIASLPAAAGSVKVTVIALCALALWVIGALDDRRTVAPKWRLLAEVGAAGALYLAGSGWDVFGFEPADFVLTAIWIVGIVNAVNLMDNLDGAAASVGGMSAAGTAAFALAHHDYSVAAMGFALAGACLGFLPFNLARPSRIFLGDGGSMPLGFVIAALAMAAAGTHVGRGDAVLAGSLLVGVPILDTSLVVISRWRRRLSILCAGCDHLTHRLLGRFGSARRVALVLATVQGVSVGAAVLGDQLGGDALLVIATAAVIQGTFAILVLERVGWAVETLGRARAGATNGVRTQDPETEAAPSARFVRSAVTSHSEPGQPQPSEAV
jgi:UDP-GlcNAc:undecaprenyl-phosphate GlcNAc-1-phosphate transferase